MSTTSSAEIATGAPATRWPRSRLLCLGAAIAAVPVAAVSTLTGDSGSEVTAGLRADTVSLTVGSLLAVLVSAALVVAAVRLGRAVPGDTGVVLIVSGALVAGLYAGYYAVFGAGAVVASQMLADPGPGLGEASLLVLNVMEIARFAPGLALVVAALAARRHLPRGVTITAGVLLALMVAPFTTWVAALLLPAWLGLSAAFTSPRSPARP